jgi:ATP adenylyltransferase
MGRHGRGHKSWPDGEHLHAMPRWVGDASFMTTVGETRVLPENVETAGERLRAALAQE